MTRALVFCLVLCGSLAATTPFQEVDSTMVNKVKAAYVYKFTRYVRWPDSSFTSDTSPLVIGVLGGDPFGPILDRLVEDNTAHGRPIVIRRLRSSTRIGELNDRIRSCHLLFIASSEATRLERHLEVAHNGNVLTVSDNDRFARRGGMIGLLLEEGRIIFEINHDVIRETDLEVSSKLLRLARIVKSPASTKPPVQRGPSDATGVERR